MVHVHTKRANIALQKLAEVDVAFSSLSLFCKQRDADKDIELYGAPKNPDGTPFTAAAWVSGRIIYYGPSFEHKTLDHQVTTCAHEILHVALRHTSRAKQLMKRFGPMYKNFIFNIAADAIINSVLVLSKRSVPSGYITLKNLFKEVFDENIEHEDAVAQWDTERLYIHLINFLKKDQEEGQGLDDQLDIIQGKASTSDDSEDASKEKGDGKGESSFVQKLRDYVNNHDFTEDFDPTGTDAEGDVEEGAMQDVEWQERLKGAIRKGQLAGTGLGKVGFKIADLPESRTPWEQQLRTLANRALTRKPRIAYGNPTRRFLAMEDYAIQTGGQRPAYEQGIVKQAAAPKLVVGIDNSGSVYDELLKEFAGELAMIGKKTGATIELMIFDTHVHSHTKMDGVNWKSEINAIEFARGGGTSFVDVVDQAAAQNPSAIIIFTDLYGPFGKEPKNIPVIWAVPSVQKDIPSVPFGRVLSLAG